MCIFIIKQFAKIVKCLTPINKSSVYVLPVGRDLLYLYRQIATKILNTFLRALHLLFVSLFKYCLRILFVHNEILLNNLYFYLRHFSHFTVRYSFHMLSDHTMKIVVKLRKMNLIWVTAKDL